MGNLGLSPLIGSPYAPVVISSMVDRQIFQRNGSNQCAVPIVGSQACPFTHIIASATKVTGQAGTNVGATTVYTNTTTAPGGYSATLTLAAGYYDLTVQAYYSSILIASKTTRIGVGDIFIIAGQSNTTNHTALPYTASADCVNSRSWLTTSTWALAADPEPDLDGDAAGSGKNGNVFTWFADNFSTHTGYPVGIVIVGQISTLVNDWTPATNTYYQRLKAAAQLFPANGFRCALWDQGDSDNAASPIAGGGTSTANYQTRLRAIISQLNTDAGWTIPWGIAIDSYYANPGGQPVGVTDSNITTAQTNVAGDSGNFQGPTYDSYVSATYRRADDLIHFTVTGVQTVGPLWTSAIATKFSI